LARTWDPLIKSRHKVADFARIFSNRLLNAPLQIKVLRRIFQLPMPAHMADKPAVEIEINAAPNATMEWQRS
jgi:hypothetical protein